MAHLRIEELQVAARTLRGQWLKRLGEQLGTLDLQRLLAGLRGEERAGHFQKVAEIDQLEAVEGLVADGIALEVYLDARGAIFDMGEDGFPHLAPQHQAPDQRDLRARRLKRIEMRQRLGGGVCAVTARWDRDLSPGRAARPASAVAPHARLT